MATGTAFGTLGGSSGGGGSFTGGGSSGGSWGTGGGAFGGSGFGTGWTNQGMGPGNVLCGDDPVSLPVARQIIEKFDIPKGNTVGGALTGYDIKAQDALTMVKLSLLQEGFGEALGAFKELYINNEGEAEVVTVNITPTPSSFTDDAICVFKSTLHQSTTKVDYVVVRGGDPLPVKKHSDSTVNVMGGYGIVQPPVNFTCGLTDFVKSNSFNQESWAMFPKSPQHPDIKTELRQAVKRSEWEQALGYKQLIPDLPATASISFSQTTPQIISMNFTGTELQVTMNLGSPEPGMGGVTDISNVNAIGAQVLDIQTGKSLYEQVKEYPSPEVPFNYGLGEDDIYVMLDHVCTLKGLSRGENWFLLPGGVNAATVQVRRSTGSPLSYAVFGGAAAGCSSNATSFNVHYFRRTGSAMTSMSDFVTLNVRGKIPPTAFEYDACIPGFNTTAPRMMFDQTYGAQETGFPGNIHPGFGTHGMEIYSMHLAYTVQRPSIQVRTAYGGAQQAAAQIGNAGLWYTPVVVVDAPAPVGIMPPGITVEFPPPAEEESTAPYCPETILDTLQGTIVDISAPFLGGEDPALAAKNIMDTINSDTGKYATISYTGGGYTLLPGMNWNHESIQGVIHSVEYVYSDKDSVSTNITIGPVYYEANSYNDSKYVKRSVHLTRTATVIEGNNAAGEFVVDVDGLGVFNAFNGILNSIYPGDRVEVKISNFVVEP